MLHENSKLSHSEGLFLELMVEPFVTSARTGADPRMWTQVRDAGIVLFTSNCAPLLVPDIIWNALDVDAPFSQVSRLPV